MKIGLISDNHSYMDDKIISHLKTCDEIWHAGDIGDIKIIDNLQKVKPTKAVWGNIDDYQMRSIIPEFQIIQAEHMKFLMIHIAGAVGSYNKQTRELIAEHQPHVLICGHSHILKVVKDSRFNLLYINPGACGHHGFHAIRTMLRLEVIDDKIAQLEAIELGKRGVAMNSEQ